ncbi:hypothetical protein LXD69_07325 [Flavobacterium sediminilitoris]|uniref:Uncharacterized protein n=1 Tax=Flavobacterium sediminilitoris TaxID=2024526 RepID=A0ABY4HR01_9FLAO|nr:MULTISPECIES: hypothetical protein [Flavobacterium]UOX35322.1 hypothetical protein LXD69_07325 [Flavobacterium sediminilitoris]
MRISYTIPQKWNDLTEWQLKRIGKLTLSKEKMPHRLFISMLISILLMPKRSLKGYIKSFYLFTQVPLLVLEEYCGFIFEEEEYLTKFPEKFKIGKTYVYGPGKRLSNITINEMSYADTFFYNWINGKKDVDLHRLAAVLYREKSPSPSPEDIRAPFNKLLLPVNADLTDKIPLADKLIIALAYQGCRQLFSKRHPIIFPKPPDEEKTPEAAKKNKKAYQPFEKIIHAMAMDEIQVFGNLQQTEQANAAQFFKIYEESIIRQRERERLAKKK